MADTSLSCSVFFLSVHTLHIIKQDSISSSLEEEKERERERERNKNQEVSARPIFLGLRFKMTC